MTVVESAARPTAGPAAAGTGKPTAAARAQRRSRLVALLALPAAAWYLVMLVIPLVTTVIISAGERGDQGGFVPQFTFSAYAALFDPLYEPVLRTTFVLAVGGTLGCFLAAYPLAYLLATRAGKRRTLGLILVVIPFWTSFLIRTYAWVTILSPTGLLNGGLGAIGIQPLDLLNGPVAVYIGILYNYLPLMVFPIYVALERLDPALVEASKDLGASRWATFRQVTWPLTLPGVATGVLLVFVPLTGEWVIPSILGGGKSYYLGTFMANQVTDSRNWPLGSAAAVLLIAVMLVVVTIYLRIVGREGLQREVSLL
ncbi:MAG TPA: ABC transporter permease [Candidatus Limnocylindrales bacterium]|nr:ABC transporter permease [Candidatus Limnocylindrales bacterium]